MAQVSRVAVARGAEVAIGVDGQSAAAGQARGNRVPGRGVQGGRAEELIVPPPMLSDPPPILVPLGKAPL